MALEDDVLKVFADLGTRLQENLWTKNDAEFLAQRAKDLVGLNVKASAATDPAKKASYRRAALLVADHVKLRALTRLAISQKHVMEAVDNLIMDILIPALGKLLASLF